MPVRCATANMFQVNQWVPEAFIDLLMYGLKKMPYAKMKPFFISKKECEVCVGQHDILSEVILQKKKKRK